MEILKDHKCADHMALISYKWNNEDNSVVYTYMCKLCNKVEKRTVYDFNGVQNLLNVNSFEAYNNGL